MRKEFVNLVESRNIQLMELASGAITHLANDLGVSEEEIIKKATELGIDVEGEFTADDITNIYTAYDVEEKEARAKAKAEIDAIYGKKTDGEDGAGGDFVLSFSDADEYMELQKDLRKGYLSSTPKLNDWMDIVGAKLQRIEDTGKQQEFQDASWKSYNNARKKWRDSNYETNYMGDFRTGGVTVKDGVMSVDMAMREEVEGIDEDLVSFLGKVGGAAKGVAKGVKGVYDKTTLKRVQDFIGNKIGEKYRDTAASIINTGSIEALKKKMVTIKAKKETIEDKKDQLRREKGIGKDEGRDDGLIKELEAQISSDRKSIANLEKLAKEHEDKLFDKERAKKLAAKKAGM
jgi:hypothetical protein